MLHTAVAVAQGTGRRVDAAKAGRCRGSVDRGSRTDGALDETSRRSWHLLGGGIEAATSIGRGKLSVSMFYVIDEQGINQP